MTILMLGNFQVVFTTENHRAKAFEKLGHNVLKFQENQTTADELLEMIDKVDMLTYSHTHGWEIKGLRNVFEAYKTAKKPTVSIHLDRWSGLARESDIGSEATWFTEYIFMADGSPEAVELYKKHKLNWHYLAPAVDEDGCYLAEPDHKRFPHEIIFVGSRGYHIEYPFRPMLVDFLKKTYGDRFQHYGNDGIGVMRENDLNTLLASSKIVVGDSCFGGRPYYVSDRVYETRGRGGFLLHPFVEGVDMHGVVHYAKENLLSLKTNIDDWLGRYLEREKKRIEGFEWVKENETYTNRAKQIIETIFK